MKRYLNFSTLMGVLMLGFAVTGFIFAIISDEQSAQAWGAYSVLALPFGAKWLLDGTKLRGESSF